MLRKFFWFCSGADVPILFREDCYTEHNKYEAIGAIIFLTSILASMSGGYALYTVFDSKKTATVFGVFWGVIVFSLDRFFVLSIRKRKDNFWEQVSVAIPRLVLAVFLAIVISKPIEFRLFEKEINAEIQRTRLESLRKEIVGLEEKREQAENLLSKKNEDITNFKIRTNVGINRFGQSFNEYSDQQKSLQKQKDALDKDVSELTKQITGLKNNLNENENARVSFLTQYITLENLTNGESNKNAFAIQKISLFTTLLFIILETSPIMVKLLSKYGPYDAVKEYEERNVEEEVEHEHRERQKNRKKVKEFVEDQFSDVLKDTIENPKYSEILNNIMGEVLNSLESKLRSYARTIDITGRDIEKFIKRRKDELLKERIRDELDQSVFRAKINVFIADFLSRFRSIIRNENNRSRKRK